MSNGTTVYEALACFRTKVEAVRKTANNPHFKSKYADLNEVLEVISKPMKECGLVFIQTPQVDGLKTIIRLSSGEGAIEGFIPFLNITDMQKLGSAMTYARRYSLVTMLGLEQEDDDGNKAVLSPETLSSYLISKGISTPKSFTEYHKITTKEQALSLLSDKAGLNQLINEFVSRSDATI